MSEVYDELERRLREVAALSSSIGLLSWDQETMMPPAAAGGRAEELSLLSRLAHERATDPRIGELLDRAASDADVVEDPVAAANLREIRRDYERALKLPADLVAEMNETSSRALEAWKLARRDSDFAAFRPWLERQIVLNRRRAECYGHPAGGEAYDALVEDYEPGMTGAELERIFEPLRAELVPLIEEIGAAGYRPSDAPQQVRLPVERQVEFNRQVLLRLGFDPRAGRLDVSVHPFSSGIGPGDTRLTTRYRDDQFAEALGSTMHEAGHALYEQGLPRDAHWGQPLAEAASLGIHESQSRMWENQVGRSREFWSWALPEAQRFFRPALDAFTVDDLHEAVNVVRPNLIRVESDEATYNLHIMLRFELERALLRGDLAAAELPAAWNECIRRDLGLEVPDDARGCLQDIHWAMGSIGYFPTYTLGNLYAAQLWETIRETLGDLDDEIARGDFSGLLGWLRENVHAHGRRRSAGELCRELTGRPLDHQALIRHLRSRFGTVYRLRASAPPAARD